MIYRLILVLIICCPSIVFSCTCEGEESVKEAIQNSDVVFLGKVLSKNIIEIKDENLPTNYSLKKAKYVLLITKIYKGVVINDSLSIITGLGSGDCGFEFEVGLDYIVYSKYSNKYFERGIEVDEFLSTDICSRTILNQKCELKKVKKYSK